MTQPEKSPCKIAVLISGGGSNLQAIIDAKHSGKLHAELVTVISNQPEAFGLKRAEKAQIPTQVIEHRDFDSREAFDQALIAALDATGADLIVLAGFMRILTTDFVRHYHGRLINIHPSLLPKFKGLNTHARALEAKEKAHGASVHFVTEELDGGPLILQASVALFATDDAEQLAKRVLAREHFILPQVIHWFAQGRLALKTQQIYLDEQILAQPIKLQTEITVSAK